MSPGSKRRQRLDEDPDRRARRTGAKVEAIPALGWTAVPCTEYTANTACHLASD